MNFLQLFYDIVGIALLWAIIQLIKHFKPKPIVTYASNSTKHGVPELKRAHAFDAGIDLVAVELKEKRGDGGIGTQYIYETQAFDIPKGYVALAFPRSSIRNTSLIMSNSVGVGDAGYIGTMDITFTKIRDNADIYNTGDRIAQLILVPVLLADAKRIEFSKLNAWSQRGTNGHGSTGK
jgi:dUTP pyrophosphatase